MYLLRIEYEQAELSNFMPYWQPSTKDSEYENRLTDGVDNMYIWFSKIMSIVNLTNDVLKKEICNHKLKA